MMNKNYYKQLSRRYFEASLSPRQERRLMHYLSRTEDSDFDAIKAVAGYFAAGKDLREPVTPSALVFFRPWLWVPSVVAAIVVVISISVGVDISRKTRQADSLASMENTLIAMFSAGADVDAELSNIMTVSK
jgi:hypothetical protein